MRASFASSSRRRASSSRWARLAALRHAVLHVSWALCVLFSFIGREGRPHRDTHCPVRRWLPGKKTSCSLAGVVLPQANPVRFPEGDLVGGALLRLSQPER